MTTEAPVKAEEKSGKEPSGKVKAGNNTDKTATPKTDNKKTAEKKAEPVKPATNTTKPDKTTKTKEKSSGGGKFLGTLALLTSLAAIGGTYWLWQQIDIALDYSQQLSAELKTDMEATKTSIENNGRLQTQQLTDEQQALAQRQAGVETQLNNLLSRIGNTTRDWNISEAAYLLQIANHKLQLQGDTLTAVTALKLADERIRTTGEPALLPVREIIATEITSLEGFQTIDTVGASLKLAAISDTIDKMPLRVRVSALDETTANIDATKDASNNIDNLPTAIWNSLKGLITVRYNERPVEALLTPTQVSNLTENLQIKLEQARLAIIKSEQALFEDNIDRAIKWLNAYYNIEHQSVATALMQLQEIRKLKLKTEFPDISASLRKLKALTKKLELQTPDKKKGGA